MFVTSVRGIYNTDLQLMIQGGTVMRNENNTITGRTCQMSGNTSSRVHSGDVSRNRRIVVRRQKIALVSVAFIALAIIICTFLPVRSVLRQHLLRFRANIIQVLKYRAVILYGRSASDHITEEYRDMNAYIDRSLLISIKFLRMRSMRDNILPPILQQYCHCREIK